MSIFNPGHGLMLFQRWTLTLEAAGKLTDDILLSHFEILSETYISGKIAFLLVKDTGQLVKYIDIQSPRNPNSGFNYADEIMCKQYVVESQKHLNDFLIHYSTIYPQSFGILDATPFKELMVISRPIPSLGKFIFVIAIKDDGLI